MPALAGPDHQRRRTEARKRRRLRVVYRPVGGLREHVAFTSDVSPRGLCLVAAAGPPAGEHLILTADLPGGSSVTLQGTVVWCRQPPRHLQPIVSAGFAVRLHGAPPAWIEVTSGP